MSETLTMSIPEAAVRSGICAKRLRAMMKAGLLKGVMGENKKSFRVTRFSLYVDVLGIPEAVAAISVFGPAGFVDSSASPSRPASNGPQSSGPQSLPGSSAASSPRRCADRGRSKTAPLRLLRPVSTSRKGHPDATDPKTRANLAAYDQSMRKAVEQYRHG